MTPTPTTENSIGFMDIETGGFKKTINPVCEVGLIVTCMAGIYKYGWSAMIKPYKLPGDVEPVYEEEAEKIHGITVEEMKSMGHDADKVAESFDIIVKHHSITHLAGHNIKAFDLNRWRFFMEQFGYVVADEIIIIDTMKIAKEKLPGLKSYSLQSLREHFGITQAHKHRALSDAYVCLEVWKKLNEV